MLSVPTRGASAPASGNAEHEEPPVWDRGPGRRDRFIRGQAGSRQRLAVAPGPARARRADGRDQRHRGAGEARKGDQGAGERQHRQRRDHPGADQVMQVLQHAHSPPPKAGHDRARPRPPQPQAREARGQHGPADPADQPAAPAEHEELAVQVVHPPGKTGSRVADVERPAACRIEPRREAGRPLEPAAPRRSARTARVAASLAGDHHRVPLPLRKPQDRGARPLAEGGLGRCQVGRRRKRRGRRVRGIARRMYGPLDLAAPDQVAARQAERDEGQAQADADPAVDDQPDPTQPSKCAHAVLLAGPARYCE